MQLAQPQTRDTLLGNEKIGKLLVKLSLPGVVAMVVQALYNFVDAIFIGRGVGVDAIGGLAIAFPVQMLILAIIGVIGIGVASIVSRNLGSGDRERAYLSAGNSFMLSFITGGLITILGLLFLNPILHLFGATDVLVGYSRTYLKIILGGAILGVFGFVASNIARSEGRALVAMVSMLVGTVLNLVLDPILIFVFKMGMAGAAYATIFSQFFSTLFMLYYFISGKSSLKIRVRHLKLQIPIITEIFAVGLPSFVRQAGGSIAMIVINNVLGKYGGSIYISCFGVINRFFNLIIMSVFGIVQGLQPIVGFNYGARKPERVKEAVKLAVTATTVICLISFVLLMMFPKQMVGLFSDDRQLIEIGGSAVRLIFLAMPLLGFQIIAASYFQALGRVKPALVLGMSRQFILLIPLVLIIPVFWGINGALLALPIADALSFVVTLAWFLKDVKLLSESPPAVALAV